MSSLSLLRLYLLAGLVAHKALWMVMEGRQRPRVEGRAPRTPRQLLVRAVKTAILIGIVVQTVTPEGWLEPLLTTGDERVRTSVGLALYTLGLALALVGRIQLGHNWSDIEAARVLSEQQVVETGIYRFIRHPIYVGDLLLLLGLELCLNSWLVFGVVLLAPVVLSQAVREERMLVETLAGYREYCARTKRFVPFLVSLTALLLVPIACSAEPSTERRATLMVDPSVTYQTINGWEATAQAGQYDESFESWAAEMLDLAVDWLGINRLRLEVRSGAENRRDYWSEFRAGKLSTQGWRSVRYSTVNDNADPSTIDHLGFHFSELDHTVDTVVLPVKRRLAANGEKLFVNLNYVAFTAQIGSGLDYLHDRPREYAEFVLATYQHLEDVYGWHPDSWEIILEPDNVRQWSGQLIGEALVATADRLTERGFEPRFVAPSTTSVKAARHHFDALILEPRALLFLDTLSYHRYSRASEANVRELADRAARYGLETAMLEHIPAGYRALHQDLQVGNNSAWQQFTIGGPEATARGGSYFLLDRSDSDHPRVVPAPRTRYLRHCFRFVRRGATRIGAVSDDSRFDPLAFVNTDGGYVVTIQITGGGRLELEGLPPGTYGIRYTLGEDDHSEPALDDQLLPDVRLGASDSLRFRIPTLPAGPTYGVATVFRRPGPS